MTIAAKDVPGRLYEECLFKMEVISVVNFVINENTPTSLVEEEVAGLAHAAYQSWKTPNGYSRLKDKISKLDKEDLGVRLGAVVILRQLDEERNEKTIPSDPVDEEDFSNVINLRDWRKDGET